MVRIIRVLAHTDPDLVVQWSGPNGTVMRVDHWDCRSGGSYRYLHIIDGVALEQLVLEPLEHERTRRRDPLNR